MLQGAMKEAEDFKRERGGLVDCRIRKVVSASSERLKNLDLKSFSSPSLSY